MCSSSDRDGRLNHRLHANAADQATDASETKSDTAMAASEFDIMLRSRVMIAPYEDAPLSDSVLPEPSPADGRSPP